MSCWISASVLRHLHAGECILLIPSRRIRLIVSMRWTLCLSCVLYLVSTLIWLSVVVVLSFFVLYLMVCSSSLVVVFVILPVGGEIEWFQFQFDSMGF